MSLILHADMDAFYASVEQRDNPKLRGLPVVVGGSGRRGVVAAASYEARAFGVRSAMPGMKARSLCPDLVFVRPRMNRYAEVSAAVREIFYRYTSVVEPLSLDEAYLDIGGSLKLFGSGAAIGRAIRRDVAEELRLAVSVGIGPGKLVAKIAGKRAKPDGMLEIAEDDVDSFLSPLPVTEVWGVGSSTEARLASLGIRTIGQLGAADPKVLERELGSWGPLLNGLARGEDLRRVESDRSRKSYGEENTFPEDVSDAEEIEAVIRAHAETVARCLRWDQRRGRTVMLKLRPSTGNRDFRLITRSVTVEPTNDGRRISDCALSLWRELGEDRPLRLVGVQISSLDGEGTAEQLGLFSQPEDVRQKALNSALDEIVSRYGTGSVRRGA